MRLFTIEFKSLVMLLMKRVRLEWLLKEGTGEFKMLLLFIVTERSSLVLI